MPKTPTMLTACLFALLACAPAAEEESPARALVDEAFMQTLTAEALTALEEGADIVLPEPVEVLLLTAEEARQRRKAYAESLGDEVGLTAAMDSLADLMFADNMLGRYLPDERVVYVIEDVVLSHSGNDRERAAEKLFPVLAHELVHAYDHMVYDCVPAPDDLQDLISRPEELPAIQAQMSLIEGRATYASELACRAAGRTPLRAFTVEQAMDAEYIDSDGSLGGNVVAGLGNSVVRMKLVQYAQGRAFAKRVHDFGGEAFFRQVFDGLPLSLAELEDFDLFLVRWAEAQEAAEDGGEEASDGEGDAAESAKAADADA